MKIIVIVATTDQELVSGILDLVTGRAQAQLTGILKTTEKVLNQAESINTDLPDPTH